MKKLILLTTTAALLIGCGNESKEKSREEIFADATAFLDSKLNTTPEEATIEFLKIDTILINSTRDREFLKMRPLLKEIEDYNAQMEYYNEIDEKAEVPPSEKTLYYNDLVLKLSDSIQSWAARNETFSKIDTMAYEVVISADGTDTQSGEVMKGIQLTVYFDKDYNLDKEINKYHYDMLLED